MAAFNQWGPWRRKSFNPELERRELSKTMLRVVWGGGKIPCPEGGAWPVCRVEEQKCFLKG